MAFKAVTNTALDIKKEKGKAYVGTYVGKEEIVTKIGPQMIYRFADEDARPFAIYGFTNLNRAMQNVGEGYLCRITYQGTKNIKTKFGMKDVHQVLVEVDDEHVPEQEAEEATEVEEVI